MAVDFAEERSGELGKRVFVSDLLGAALQSSFTGTLRLERPDGPFSVELKGGRPAAVLGGDQDRVGELLARGGHLRQSELGRALERQGEDGEALLGALLVQDAGVEPDEVKRAVQAQTRARLGKALAWTEGSWTAQAGASADPRNIGVPQELMALLIEQFPTHASDAELKSFVRGLLGKSVRLRPGGGGAVGQSAKGAAAKLVHYLEKPRKPDQLERAISDRRGVRVLLKLLHLNGRLQLEPLAKAIPIPQATLLKGQATVSFVVPAGGENEPPPDSPPPAAAAAVPEGPPPDEPSPATRKLMAKIDEMHAKLAKMDHFEVLGVKREAEPSEIRDAFRSLAKTYHPDALGAGVSESQAARAREVAARINEAHQTLSNEKARAEYVAMLADERIKGDARKVEQVRDAELKSKMGVVMMRKRDFAEARRLFKEAMTRDEVTVLYKAQFAHAMHADARFDRQEAFEKGYPLMLDALKSLGDSHADVNLWAGQMLKEQERLKEAMHYFKQAARLDKNNAEAKTEVRLLESRLKREAGAKKDGGGLSKFFKR